MERKFGFVECPDSIRGRTEDVFVVFDAILGAEFPVVRVALTLLVVDNAFLVARTRCGFCEILESLRSRKLPEAVEGGS